MEINRYEAKTEEEAVKEAIKKLNCAKENFIYNSKYIEGKLFKSSKYQIEVVKIEDIKDYINEFFKQYSKLTNIEINSDILYNNESFNVVLVTNNNSILIGKEGKNLNALQNILRQNLKIETGMYIKINIDVSNYKIKKLNNLEKEVRKIAKEIIKTKLDVSLDPMNSYERRYIHNIINEYENLKTESIGEGKERHIVIKYIEN